MQWLWWNLVYLFRKTPWDTGITPPEVRAVVESGRVHTGRALDLGCGTGTNVIYLAQRGFQVIGVDISACAVAAARCRIERAGLSAWARVYVGDAARLDTLPITGPFDLALDIGCLHTLDSQSRVRYAAGLARYMHPGSLYLLYAFGTDEDSRRRSGISPQAVQELFAPAFELLQVVHGQDRGGVPSAWYTFQRSSCEGTR